MADHKYGNPGSGKLFNFVPDELNGADVDSAGGVLNYSEFVVLHEFPPDYHLLDVSSAEVGDVRKNLAGFHIVFGNYAVRKAVNVFAINKNLIF